MRIRDNEASGGVRRITSGIELRGSLLVAVCDLLRSLELMVWMRRLVVGRFEFASSTMHSRTVIRHCDIP